MDPSSAEPSSAEPNSAPDSDSDSAVSRASPCALPGAEPPTPDLGAKLQKALAARGSQYVPRTHHQINDSPVYTNRLILETSPYLLQHAHNPVNWYPWGPEAFAEAQRTGRPVFLSIGYSTCHWCHVMEEESFEDLEIAELLNRRYVAIKVDREERPDIDAVYMAAVQALTGGGGWPMSVWLTPAQEPFFGGTYFPARDGDRGAAPGFLTILAQLAGIYREQPERVRRATTDLVAVVRRAVGSGAAGRGATTVGALAELRDAPPITAAVAFFKDVFDDRFGGVRRAPKFFSNLPVRLLLRRHRRTGDPRALAMVVSTLERVAAGGICDQLAGGFHRYSTDSAWLVPHFEKMLYDNALIATAYAEAYQVTRRPDFARVLRQTLDYVLRDMTSPEGAFYSATDADSQGVEGKFFVWSVDEVHTLLGTEADRFIRFYGMTPAGNFEGQNILHVPQPDDDEWHALAAQRRILLSARQKRVPPLRDEKVLAGWNGLMISALASGGRALDEPRYITAAARAADFVLGAMQDQGRLLRTYTAGRARMSATLEDHAFLVQGLLDLYEASFEVRWLAGALALSDLVEQRFADRDAGGWFETADDAEKLLVREKSTRDGATPAGASVALLNALRLGVLTAADRWRQVAEGAFHCYGRLLAEEPTAFADMLLALDFAIGPSRAVVLVWPETHNPPAAWRTILHTTFLPNDVILGAAAGQGVAALGELAPVACDKTAADSAPTAYVCEAGQCLLPARTTEELQAQLT